MSYTHLTQFELRQICYFMAVIEADNSFTQAAISLGIKQPPVTQRIQALEKALSAPQPDFPVQLFDRTRRPIQLTEAGQAFYTEVKLALFHLDRAVLHARQVSQGKVGRLIIGLNNAVANTVLPDIIQAFQQRYPLVDLELCEVSIQQEILLLKNRQLDIIFQRSPSFEMTDDTLQFRAILEEYFVVALPVNHPLANESRIELSAIAQNVIILPPVDLLPFYKQVISLCREAGFEPKINTSATVTGVVTLLSLVAAGIGISILPNHVQTLRREGVVYKPLHSDALNRQIAAVWRQDDDSVVLQQFLKMMWEAVALSDSW